MPKFAIISPTHIEGKKKGSWANFRDGGYVACISRVREDLSKKTLDEILEIARTIPRDSELVRQKRIREYEAFFSLEKGDYVAVSNTNDGLFGIEVIASKYYFKKEGHNTGSTDPRDYYNHFYDVKWLVTSYMKRKDIINADEKGWPPYGIINVFPDIPPYIKRILKSV